MFDLDKICPVQFIEGLIHRFHAVPSSGLNNGVDLVGFVVPDQAPYRGIGDHDLRGQSSSPAVPFGNELLTEYSLQRK